jgi:hypothetical protein
MWEQLQRFRGLDPAARGLFLRAFVLLPMISWSLRLRGCAATQAALSRFLASPGATDRLAADEEAARVAQTVRMVRAAARYAFGRCTCLERSLTLWSLLQRQGISSNLRYGARKTAGQLEAHAWIDYNGSALDEGDEPAKRYAVFDGAFPVQPPTV